MSQTHSLHINLVHPAIHVYQQQLLLARVSAACLPINGMDMAGQAIRCLLSSKETLFACPIVRGAHVFVDGSAETITDTSDVLLLLLLLVLDDETLESQIPVGRQLLLALSPLKIESHTKDGRQRRALLVAEVRDCLMQHSFWENVVSTHKSDVVSSFRRVKKARQKPLEEGLHAWLSARGAAAPADGARDLPMCYPSMLQMKYANGFRDHVLVSR